MENTSLSKDPDVESDGGTRGWETFQFVDSANAMDFDERQLSSDLEKHLTINHVPMESEMFITGPGGQLVKKENRNHPCMYAGQTGSVLGGLYSTTSYQGSFPLTTSSSHVVHPESHNTYGQCIQDDSLSSFDLEMDKEPSIQPFNQVRSHVSHPSDMDVGFRQDKYPHEDKLRRYEGEMGVEVTNTHHQIWQQKVQQPSQTAVSAPVEHDLTLDEESYTFEPDEFGDGPLHTLSAVTDKTTLIKAIDVIQKCGIVRQCINHQNKLKQTPLFLSVLQKNIPMVGWLLDNGADPNIQGTLYTDRDEYMWRSPLHLAAMNGDGYLSILHLLLSKSPVTNINLLAHGDRLSALHLALKHHSLTNTCRQVILELINKGADVSLREQCSSKTPFMLALETRDLSLVQEFLNKFPADRRRAILQEKARSGDTCLHIAAGLSRISSEDKVRLLRYLVTNGANGHVTNNVKELPRDFARKEWDNILKT